MRLTLSQADLVNYFELLWQSNDCAFVIAQVSLRASLVISL